MADELYTSFDEALFDFRTTEGERSYKRLLSELQALYVAGRFPPIASIKSAYHDPFWRTCSRIVVLEDLEASGIMSSDVR